MQAADQKGKGQLDEEAIAAEHREDEEDAPIGSKNEKVQTTQILTNFGVAFEVEGPPREIEKQVFEVGDHKIIYLTKINYDLRPKEGDDRSPDQIADEYVIRTPMTCRRGDVFAVLGNPE